MENLKESILFQSTIQRFGLQETRLSQAYAN